MATTLLQRVYSSVQETIGSSPLVTADVLQWLNDGCQDVYYRYKRYLPKEMGIFQSTSYIYGTSQSEIIVSGVSVNTASPSVFTKTNHGLTNGQVVDIKESSFTEAVSINGIQNCIVTALDADTFTLAGVTNTSAVETTNTGVIIRNAMGNSISPVDEVISMIRVLSFGNSENTYSASSDYARVCTEVPWGIGAGAAGNPESLFYQSKENPVFYKIPFRTVGVTNNYGETGLNQIIAAPRDGIYQCNYTAPPVLTDGAISKIQNCNAVAENLIITYACWKSSLSMAGIVLRSELAELRPDTPSFLYDEFELPQLPDAVFVVPNIDYSEYDGNKLDDDIEWGDKSLTKVSRELTTIDKEITTEKNRVDAELNNHKQKLDRLKHIADKNQQAEIEAYKLEIQRWQQDIGRKIKEYEWYTQRAAEYYKEYLSFFIPAKRKEDKQPKQQRRAE